MQSYLTQLVQSADVILLLQGPVGHFFTRFATWLRNVHGKTVYKINFNGGDEYFYPENIADTFAYRDTYDHFDSYLSQFVAANGIQAVVCFGDTRPYHAMAKQVCRQSDISFWAFEEGYFRPYFVTLEQDGVNAFSPLPRTPEFFQTALPSLAQQEYCEPAAVKGGFLPTAKLATRYYWQTRWRSWKYPHNLHHRHANLRHYIRLWTRSGIKRLFYALADRHFAKRVESGEFGIFYIVPLQVFDDSQVRIHCDFSSVRNFLLHVLASFSAHAPRNVKLIVKHHPMDRGFIDYQQDIDAFIDRHPHLSGRILYVHDVPLPVFLRHGAGMVTLNSTSGLSALIHNMPVKTLGRAAYDIEGITDQGSLADFWTKPTPPDAGLFHAYRMFHINRTQINGNFYSTVNLPES